MAEVGERKKLSHGLLSCFFCGHGITKEEPVQSAVSDEDGITTRSSRTSTAAAVDHNLLGKIADAFKELAEVVAAASNNAEEAVEVAAFARACSFVAPLFGLVGFHFKFIEMDYVTKVNDLMEASKSFKTLESMVDEDVKTNTVRKQGSHSRNLLKIKQGNSVRDAVSKAYTEIFHLHHGWALRKAVSSRLHHIPTKQQLFRKLNQDESSGRVLMQAYVTASPALLQYIDNIFLSRELGIDW
ncbi:Accelerated cell death [Arachis hypogaea]|nr:Accelerated cell death [Arachis hypogaea]